MDLSVNSNEKLPLTFHGNSLRAHMCPCVPLPSGETQGPSFSPSDKSDHPQGHHPQQIPTARSLTSCLASWEDSLFFKLSGRRGRRGTSLHSQGGWERQQHLLLPRNSSPLGDTLPQLEMSTGGGGLFWALSRTQGKEKARGEKKRERLCK